MTQHHTCPHCDGPLLILADFTVAQDTNFSGPALEEDYDIPDNRHGPKTFPPELPDQTPLSQYEIQMLMPVSLLAMRED